MDQDFDRMFKQAQKAQGSMVKTAVPLVIGAIVVNGALFVGAVYCVFWMGSHFGVW